MRAIRRQPGAFVAVSLLLAGWLVVSGCATWRGARLYQSGTRALESGDVAGALEDLGEAARLVPEASEIQNHLGLAWLEAGEPERARQAFARAVALDCDNRAASDNLARIEEQLEREERAAALRRIAGPQAEPGPSAPALGTRPPRRSP